LFVLDTGNGAAHPVRDLADIRADIVLVRSELVAMRDRMEAFRTARTILEPFAEQNDAAASAIWELTAGGEDSVGEMDRLAEIMTALRKEMKESRWLRQRM